MQASEALKRSRRGTKRNQQTLTTSFLQSLPAIFLARLPCKMVPSPCNGLVSYFFLRGSGTKIDTRSRTAHLFSKISTSLPGIAAIATCNKAYFSPLCLQVTTFLCGELHTVILCSIPKKPGSWKRPLCPKFRLFGVDEPLQKPKIIHPGLTCGSRRVPETKEFLHRRGWRGGPLPSSLFRLYAFSRDERVRILVLGLAS